jgi:uncharacterized protein with von Willebrand factor type A (vWA) domain
MPVLDLMSGFIAELRNAGLPVSLTENLDAMEAVKVIPIEDRDAFKYALGATLVKNNAHWRVFETIFEVYFSLRGPEYEISQEGQPDDFWREMQDQMDQVKGQGEGKGSGGGMDSLTPEEIAAMLMRALMNGDQAMMRALAKQSVQRFAGMEPGRPVGGTYYLYRTLRNLDLDNMLQKLMDANREMSKQELSSLEERLEKDEFESRIEQFKQEVEAEIRRRLVADRGAEAMAKTLRKPLPEDVEFMHASRDEMQSLKKALYPLTRKLAARLARKRRHGRKGPLDFRNTVRHSLSYGGVPADPKFRYPRPAKPELMVVADIYEVTKFFKSTEDIGEAINRVNSEADVVWVDGHSDYGHAFEVFFERYGKDINSKTTVLLLGDARNNYHAAQSWVVKEMRKRARHVYWLNPEPKSYWNTGDSIVGEYGAHTDGVFECRNLRQLEGFVENLA